MATKTPDETEQTTPVAEPKSETHTYTVKECNPHNTIYNYAPIVNAPDKNGIEVGRVHPGDVITGESAEGGYVRVTTPAIGYVAKAVLRKGSA